MKKCLGCGCSIQTTNKDKLGYVRDESHDLCMRCFNIRNYNKNICKDYTEEQFIDILQNIPENNLIVMIVDVFDLNSTLLTSISKVFRDFEILLFVNKIDILPDYINIDKLFNNIQAMYKSMKLNIVGGTLISAKHHFNIDYAKELIDDYIDENDVYIVGVSNVGKSQFVDAFLQECGIHDNNITISNFPATTLDILKFKYGNTNVYDTPGVINKGQLIHYVKEEDIKIIFPKKLKQVIYQLYPGTSLFVADYLRIEFDEGDKTSFTMFFGEALPIHRRKTNNNEAFAKEHLDDILLYSYAENEKIAKEFNLKAGDEVAISGLGFFSVNNDVRVAIYLKRGIDIVVRKALFK